ncbi:hypothetical protein C2G38_2142820 [Gigaspora rosea]|uniref:Zn(2)-C6 fungal-type domain-containing protein n=1 Tax=Gigaspora rosea TaxID=44941 RepID=A0A397V3B4_9GLOM|nr:hypothetical protein C2G38_2142820 [Gigaspora rosea]CAG8676644.1 18172_t:CDS:1 [Gigaspora rosea]
MPQQRSRNHATQACTNCQNKRQKCKRLSDRDACENCKNNKSRCVIIWGRKRGRKPSPNQTTEAVNEFQFSSSNFETLLLDDQSIVLINPYASASRTTDVFINQEPTHNYHVN